MENKEESTKKFVRRQVYTYSDLQKHFRENILHYEESQPISFREDLDDTRTPNGWVKFWDNDKRIRITMHMDLAIHIGNDKAAGIDTDNLGLQPGPDGEIRFAKDTNEEYLFFRVVRYNKPVLDM